jgi:hypothetical protein
VPTTAPDWRARRELLLTLASWEEAPTEPDPADSGVLRLPAPLARRRALHALNRIQRALQPTQFSASRRRLLAPDGRYEHLPLHLINLDPHDLELVAAAGHALAHELATRPSSDLSDPITAGAAATTTATTAAEPDHGPAPQAVLDGLFRVRDPLGATNLLMAVAGQLAFALAGMVAVGVANIAFNTMARGLLQLRSAPEMQGRVMALHGLLNLGTTPLGGPLLGWVCGVAGSAWGSVVAGGAALLATAVVARRLLA